MTGNRWVALADAYLPGDLADSFRELGIVKRPALGCSFAIGSRDSLAARRMNYALHKSLTGMFHCDAFACTRDARVAGA